MHDPFDYYPASSYVIRGAAEGTRTNGISVRELMGRVEQDHQAAVGAVDGAMKTQVMSSPDKAKEAADFIARKTAWAACQLEYFADAVDTFDFDSPQPRSVSKLNTAYWAASATNFGAGGDPMGPWADKEDQDAAEAKHSKAILTGRQTLMATLQAEYVRLDAQLDAAATSVSSNLRREPTAEELRAAWKAGNLPMNAAMLWPDLHLAVGDIAGIPPDLDTLTDSELADWILAHPAMDPALYQQIAKYRAGAIMTIASRFQTWQLQSHGNLVNWDAFYAAWQNSCPPNGGGGVIIGPDGRPYAVTVPGAGPQCPPGETCIGPANGIFDDGQGSGWNTLGTKDGVVKLGKEITAAEMAAFVIAGTAGVGKPFGDTQSIGEEQDDYVITRPDGSASINDGTQVPTEIPEAPPVLPPEEDVWSQSRREGTMSRAQGGLDVLIGGMEGLENGEQAKANQSYASQVVFQENVNGDRRAIINLYQVQSDGERLLLKQAFGTIDENGDVVPATR